MKFDGWISPSRKLSAAPAPPGASPAKPHGPQTKGAPLPAGAQQTAGGEERRRTQRVLLRVRANIHVAIQGKTATFEASTLSVNPHGAVIITKQSIPLGTPLVLEHVGSKQIAACKVARAARQMQEGFHIPIEFEAPEPDFWGIAFPPTDWRPEDT